MIKKNRKQPRRKPEAQGSLITLEKLQATDTEMARRYLGSYALTIAIHDYLQPDPSEAPQLPEVSNVGQAYWESLHGRESFLSFSLIFSETFRLVKLAHDELASQGLPPSDIQELTQAQESTINTLTERVEFLASREKNEP